MMGFFFAALLFSSGDSTVLESGGHKFVEAYTKSSCKKRYRRLVNIGTITLIGPADDTTIIKTHYSRFYICRSYDQLISDAKQAAAKLKEKKNNE